MPYPPILYKTLRIFVSSLYYWLRYGIPVEARFFGPVQTGPEAQSASYKMDKASPSRGKSGRIVVITSHPFYHRGREWVKQYLHFPPCLFFM
jgi:hypothetical protein